MYWQHSEKPGCQILISKYSFPENTKMIVFPSKEFDNNKCPIPIEEFEKYYGFPRGLRDFEKIKEYLLGYESNGFICFTGITQEAM